MHTATVDWPATTATDYLILCSTCTEKRQIGSLTVKWLALEFMPLHNRHGSIAHMLRGGPNAISSRQALIAAPDIGTVSPAPAARAPLAANMCDDLVEAAALVVGKISRSMTMMSAADRALRQQAPSAHLAVGDLLSAAW